jgi:hypothetical protein
MRKKYFHLWLLKTNSLLLAFSLITILKINAQNNIWSLPSSYFNNVSVQGLPIGGVLGLDYQGEQAQNVHNTMQDANGNLLFFVIDGKVFDKDGYFIDEMYHSSYGTIQGGQEIAIVPDPGNCQRYYLFSSTQGNFPRPFYSILDLNLPNQWTNGRNGALENFSSGNAQVLSLPSNDWFRGRIGFAASKLRSDNSRFLFVHDGLSNIYRMRITLSGPIFDNYIINCGGEESSVQRAELELLELPNGEYKLASSSTQTSGINSPSHVFHTTLNSSGNIIPGTNQFYYFYNTTGYSVNATYPFGLEFSPNGNYLYVVHNVTPNHPNPIEYIDVSTNISYPIVVSGQSDFQRTQIEIGKDNKLYFATNNRLATLSNPNTPAAANWNNSAHLITYNQTLDYAGPQFVSSYTLPDQIDGMNYSSHFSVNTQCCISSSYYDATVFNVSSNATWTAGVSTNPFASTTGTVFIEKELIIPAGKTVTIQNMTFKFAPGAKVVVERGNGLAGGKLILDGTTFSADTRCDTNAMWLGVQVHGYNNQNQISNLTSQQGWFIMQNKSVIEHALKGAVAVKINSSSTYPYNFTSYDFNYTGGVIQARNSTFKNNRQDIEFRKYNAPNGSNNQSLFTRCVFYTTGLLNNESLYPTYHVFMHDVVGIQYYGNKFRNDTPNEYTYWKQGWGIYSVDAQYFVNAACNNNTIPCTNIEPNEFSSLYFGIRALSGNGLKTLKVDQSEFTNNYFGIYLGGPDFATITRNKFEVYRSAAPNQTFNTYGLYLNGCSAYTVEENTYSEFNDPFVSTNGNSYGIIVNNSGPSNNTIYRNDFFNLKVGGQSQNINSVFYNPGDENPNNVGLQWKCNNFIKDIYEADLAVTSGRIAFQQGYCVSPVTQPLNAIKSPAGNRFSHSTFDPQNDFAANNSVLEFNYSHHADVITTPLYYNTAIIAPQQCFNSTYPVYYNYSNSCPSKIKNGITLHTTLKEKSDSLKLVISSLENQVDAGNTNNLLNIISTLSTTEVKNELLAASPYLSEQVLIAYMTVNPPVEYLEQIIIANSPVSDSITALLNSMSLPEETLSEINNAQSGVSAMTYLLNETGYFKSERNGLIDERIRLLINDTLISNPLDSIAIILNEESIEIRKKQLCDTYIAKGDSINTSITRDSLVTEFGYDNYIKMADLYQLLREEPSSCYALNTNLNIKQEVEYVAYDQDDRINSVKGEALLSVSFDSLFLAVIEPLATIGSGLRMKGNNSDLQSDKVNFLTIFPNPSNGESQVILELKEINGVHLENTSIEVFTISGQIVANYRFNDMSNQVFINPDKLTPGIYIVKLYDKDEVIESQKLIINY